jgi:hypothetical protein
MIALRVTTYERPVAAAADRVSAAIGADDTASRDSDADARERDPEQPAPTPMPSFGANRRDRDDPERHEGGDGVTGSVTVDREPDDTDDTLASDESTERMVQRHEFKIVLPDSGKLAIIALAAIELASLWFAPSLAMQTTVFVVIAIGSLGGYALHQWFTGTSPADRGPPP